MDEKMNVGTRLKADVFSTKVIVFHLYVQRVDQKSD